MSDDSHANYRVCWDTYGGYVASVPRTHAKYERDIWNGKIPSPFKFALIRNGSVICDRPVPLTPKGRPKQKSLFDRAA